MRQREHLTVLLPVRGCLVVSTMRFEEDLVELPRASRPKVSAQELKLADQLISHLAGDWTPHAYHDDYVPALMKVIKAKAKGKKVPAVSEKPTPPTKVVDLVERLRESLAAAQKSSRPKRARTRARKRSAA
jgi:DNA end-binding protein Ku